MGNISSYSKAINLVTLTALYDIKKKLTWTIYINLTIGKTSGCWLTHPHSRSQSNYCTAVIFYSLHTLKQSNILNIYVIKHWLHFFFVPKQIIIFLVNETKKSQLQKLSAGLNSTLVHVSFSYWHLLIIQWFSYTV